MSKNERPFSFLRMNDREAKPRQHGITEIRGPYYTPMGRRYLQDVLETMGEYVDILKFAGGSFSLMPRDALCSLIKVCHDHNVEVSTGGFIEHVLTQGPEAVDRYLATSRNWASILSRCRAASSACQPTIWCGWSSVCGTRA